MVHIWRMRVRMRNGVVRMFMGVGFARANVIVVSVTVMLVVNVPVSVRQMFVNVSMLVTLGQV